MHPYGVKYTPTFWNDEKSWGSNQAVQAERNILPLKTQAFPSRVVALVLGRKLILNM